MINYQFQLMNLGQGCHTGGYKIKNPKAKLQEQSRFWIQPVTERYYDQALAGAFSATTFPL